MAGNDWDVNVPIDHSKISARPSQTRDLKSSTKTIIQKEHVALGASNLGGQHLKGSARVYMSDSLPGTDPESNNLDTAATSDDGRLAVVTAAATGVYNTLKVYMATAAGISTGWEGIRVAEAGTSSRVRLANAVSIAGYSATSVFTAYNVVCMSTGGIPRLASGLNAVLMPATAPTTDAHVANRKYVDDQITAVVPFGVPDTKDDQNNDMVKDAVYEAQQDGFVTVYSDGNNSATPLLGFIGSTSTPALKVAANIAAASPKKISIMFPVKSGWFFKVTGSVLSITDFKMYWHPIGAYDAPVIQ